MPFPNEHACRLRSPDDFQADSFRRIRREADGKPLDIILGRLKGQTTTTAQAFRYPKGAWEPGEARSHCEANDGKLFEPATEEAVKIALQHVSEWEREAREAELEALDAYRRGIAAAPVVYRPFGFRLAGVGLRENGLAGTIDSDRAMTDPADMVFVASEESVDRLGDVIEAAGWRLDAFKRNPVLMFAHAYSTPPVGTVPRVWIADTQLLNTVRFDEGDEFALLLKGKYERGVMRAESVGFRPLEFEQRTKAEAAGEPNGKLGLRFKAQELLEISVVPVPMHPSALHKALAIEPRFYLLPSGVFAPSQRAETDGSTDGAKVVRTLDEEMARHVSRLRQAATLLDDVMHDMEGEAAGEPEPEEDTNQSTAIEAAPAPNGELNEHDAGLLLAALRRGVSTNG